jgi:hypothetical protein
MSTSSSMQCAGLNRHEAGNERVLRERSSEPLGPEFCVAHREVCGEALNRGTGGLGIELRKDAIRTLTLLHWRKAIWAGAISQVPARSCVVVDPRHAWKLHAREPGDLGDACCCLTGQQDGG